MTEPRRAMLVREVESSGKAFRVGTPVWILERFASGEVRVELKGGREVTLGSDAVVETPVPKPSDAQLVGLDPCFVLGKEAFEVVHASQQWYYEIRRCRAHGNVFLLDVRGGIAMYERLIFVGPPADDSYDEVYGRFHRVSDDELFWRGIAR